MVLPPDLPQDLWLDAFTSHQAHLRRVALRMLGSAGEAEDAIAETWFRFSRSGGAGIDNLAGWLTTVLARICLDMLRARRSRPEDPHGVLPEGPADGPDPVAEAELADALGPALLLVLDTLNPAERLAFVLHDLFAVPFEEIAAIVGRSAGSVRQSASRARRRVQGAAGDEPAPESDPRPEAVELARQRAIVDAFLAASRAGNFSALLRLLHPEATLDADAAALAMGGAGVARGAEHVARSFSGKAKAVRRATVDGRPGAAWTHLGVTRVVFRFTLDGRSITGVQLLADPDTIEKVQLEFLPALREDTSPEGG